MPINSQRRTCCSKTRSKLTWRGSSGKYPTSRIWLPAALRSDDVQVTLVKDGDHRLSRPEDVARLLAIVEQHLLSA